MYTAKYEIVIAKAYLGYIAKLKKYNNTAISKSIIIATSSSFFEVVKLWDLKNKSAKPMPQIKINKWVQTEMIEKSLKLRMFSWMLEWKMSPLIR